MKDISGNLNRRRLGWADVAECCRFEPVNFRRNAPRRHSDVSLRHYQTWGHRGETPMECIDELWGCHSVISGVVFGR